mmetsp:Transcript_7804/g.11935  ORF Transcript_7804/g.11935 Transcript_7804/m.11935 type:complete len:92 (+) Transcript_7804:155-430(+)
MSNTKLLTFSEHITTYEYSRPTASEIQELYYQEEDYRRFREEKWLDEMREKRQNNLKKTKMDKSRRRDSLTLVMNPTFKSSQNRRGIAKAA